MTVGHRFIAAFRLVAFLTVVLATATPGSADTIVVGSDAGCTHPTLEAAFLKAAFTSASDTIRIAENVTFTGSTPLNLTDAAAVTLEGVRGCSDARSYRRDITATRGDLFELVNTDLTVRGLRLVSGTDGGRPLTASGSSLVTLEDDVIVLGGKASSGGNVHLSGGASLRASSDAGPSRPVSIYRGDADFDGGGIYCTGPGTVTLETGSIVDENSAGFNGGGIYLTGGCTLELLSGGPRNLGGGSTDYYGVFDNSAGFNGGGIYATSGATVTVVGASSIPASIRKNTAGVRGGGIYLTGGGTSGGVFSSELVDNHATEQGGGVFVTAGARFDMRTDIQNCARGFRCSLLEGNHTVTPVGTIGEGGTIAVAGGGKADIRQTYVTGSSSHDGGKVALVEGTDSALLLEGNVLFDNTTLGPHVLARNGGHAVVAFSSVWGSANGANTKLLQAGSQGRVDLYSSVVIEPGWSVFGPVGTGGVYEADCVIAHESASFPEVWPGSVVLENDPAQVWSAPGSGDPHLRSGSVAIDFCDASIYPPDGSSLGPDIDLEARGENVPGREYWGSYDLGADEWYPASGPIFADGFESGGTGAWSSAVP